MSILSCDNLIKTYNGKKVVNKISFELHPGKVVGLLGPNGAGKTTTFFMIVGLVGCDSGKIFIDDVSVTNLPMHLRSKSGISYLPQEASIFRNLSVRDNIFAILETRTNLDDNQKIEKLNVLSERLNIKHLHNSIGESLSGGERRRVEIARALALDPKFLLLDEPFAGIDPISVIEIQKIIKELSKINIGILITDHNVRETLGVCDSVLIINAGNVIASGTSSQILKDKMVRKVYLGKEFKL